MDYYTILNLSPDADDDAIRTAYHRQAQQYHPDKVQHLGAEFRELAERKMRELNEAYEVLRDPERRREYDARRQTSPQTDASEPPPSQTAPPRTHGAGFRVIGIAASLLVVGALVILFVNLFVVGRQLSGGRGRQSERQTSNESAFQEAKRLYDGGHWEQSLTRLHRITETRPEDFAAWNLRWMAEIRLGLTRDAAKSLERAVALRPTDVNLRVEYARALFYANELGEAKAQLRWLTVAGQAATVVRLLDSFRSHNPEAAAKLAE